MQENFESGRKFKSKKPLQDFDAKETHLHPKNRSVSFRSKNVEKFSVFIIFECSHDAVPKMCRLEFRFQNLPFSKSAGKMYMTFSCEREAYPSHLSPFSECAGIV